MFMRISRVLVPMFVAYLLSGCGASYNEFETYVSHFSCSTVDFVKMTQSLETLNSMGKLQSDDIKLISLFEKLDQKIVEQCPLPFREQCSPGHVESKNDHGGTIIIKDHEFLDGPIYSFGIKAIVKTNRPDLGHPNRRPIVYLYSANKTVATADCYRDMAAHAKRGLELVPSRNLSVEETLDKDLVIHISKNIAGPKVIRDASTKQVELANSQMSCRFHVRYLEPESFFGLSDPWYVVSAQRVRIARTELKDNTITFYAYSTDSQIVKLECELKNSVKDSHLWEIEDLAQDGRHKRLSISHFDVAPAK